MAVIKCVLLDNPDPLKEKSKAKKTLV